MNAYKKYLTQVLNKTQMKVFLVGGAMLSGKITDFDEDFIVLDSCLIPIDKIISIAYMK